MNTSYVSHNKLLTRDGIFISLSFLLSYKLTDVSHNEIAQYCSNIGILFLPLFLFCMPL